MIASARPPGGDVGRILTGRAIRGFADGFVSVLLAQYLTALGFSPGAGRRDRDRHAARIGGAHPRRSGSPRTGTTLRTLLIAATVLMAATGIGFLSITWFWPLLVVAVLGTLNPSAGDVSVFLPAEQAFVAAHVDGAAATAPVRDRTTSPAIWAGAIGALLSGVPVALAKREGWDSTTAQRASFGLYAASRGRDLLRVPPAEARRRRASPRAAHGARRACCRHSRRTVLELAALVQPRLRGRRLRRHVAARACGSTCASTSRPARPARCSSPPGCSVAARSSSRRASRPAFGLIRTMAFTHMPGQRVAGADGVRAERRRSRSRCCSSGRCSRRWTSPPARRS